MSTITIRGYCDAPSAAPGETIRFFVSSDRPGEYRADIVRLLHGDTNPKGPGFKEELLETRVSGRYPARFQRTQFGSYVEIADRGALHPRAGLTVHAFVWPTTPTRGRQGIVSRWADDVKAGWVAFAIFIGLILAVAFLGYSLVKQLRKVDAAEEAGLYGPSDRKPVPMPTQDPEDQGKP